MVIHRISLYIPLRGPNHRLSCQRSSSAYFQDGVLPRLRFPSRAAARGRISITSVHSEARVLVRKEVYLRWTKTNVLSTLNRLHSLTHTSADVASPATALVSQPAKGGSTLSLEAVLCLFRTGNSWRTMANLLTYNWTHLAATVVHSCRSAPAAAWHQAACNRPVFPEGFDMSAQPRTQME